MCGTSDGDDRGGSDVASRRGKCRTTRESGRCDEIGRPGRAGCGSVRTVEGTRGNPFLDLFFGLVAGPGTAGGAHGTTDHGTRRTCDSPTDERADRAAADRAGSGPGLVIAFGGLAHDRAADRTDGPADDGTDRATDRHPDGRAAKGAGAGTKGFGPAFFILRRRAFVLVRRDAVCVVDWMIVVQGRRQVVVITCHCRVSFGRSGHGRRVLAT
jgi:hypothetical protein